MLRLLELREFCDTQENRKLVDVLLTDVQWEAIGDILKVLEPFFKYTIQLQSEQCTLSDFFGFWKSIELKLHRIVHPLSIILLQEMTERKATIMGNPALLGAVYLDPRYQRALDDPQRQAAIPFLVAVHRKIEAIEKRPSQPDNIVADEADTSENDLLSYLDSCEREELIATSDSTIETKLTNFKNIKYPLNRPAFEFWDNEKSNYPELYKIASAVLAIPPTQCSVERAF